MKFLVSLLLLTSTSLASSLDQAFLANERDCSAVVSVQDNMLIVGHNKFDQESRKYFGLYKLTDLNTPDLTVPLITENGSAVVDIIKYEDSLFVLTKSALLERSLKDYSFKGAYPTYPNRAEFGRKQSPTGMELVEDKLYISHGRLGYTVFDINSRALERVEDLSKQANLEGEESTVTDVLYLNGLVYFLLDNYTIKTHPRDVPAFRGFAVFSPQHKQVVKFSKIRDAGATALAKINDGNILVSYQGFVAVTEYNPKDILNAEGVTNYSRRAWKYPKEHYGSNRGKMHIANNKMYTCFKQSEDEKTFRNKRRIFNLDYLNWRGR